MARDSTALRAELDVPAKLNGVVRRRPLVWLGGAAALGWMLAGPKTRTRTVTKYAKTGRKPARAEEKVVTRTGFVAVFFAMLRFLVPVLKPIASAYATRMVAEAAGKLAR